MELNYVTVNMDHKRKVLSDKWRLPLVALQTTIAVSNGQVDSHPWEKMVWQDSIIMETMRTLKAPESFVRGIRPLRRQVCRILTGVETISQMKKVLAPHVKNLLVSYPDFELDIKFLYDCAEPVIREVAQSLMLKPMPQIPSAGGSSDSRKVTLGECLTQLQAWCVCVCVCLTVPVRRSMTVLKPFKAKIVLNCLKLS